MRADLVLEDVCPACVIVGYRRGGGGEGHAGWECAGEYVLVVMVGVSI